MKVTIYGERCSGTTYLEELLKLNFEVTMTWDYGWKHFFGFNDLSNTDDVLFIGIIRNLPDWLNSFYKNPHHIPKELKNSVDDFLTRPFYSLDTNPDVHLETKERYKNIYELRHVKNKFLIETMPKLVKNYCLITYDELVDNFHKTMNKLKQHLTPTKHFPSNINYYKNQKDTLFTKKKTHIIPKSRIMIESKPYLYYENKLFPNQFKEDPQLNQQHKLQNLQKKKQTQKYTHPLQEPVRQQARRFRQAPVRQAPVRQAPVRQAPVRQQARRVRQAPVRPVRQALVRQAPIRQVHQAIVHQSLLRQALLRQALLRKALRQSLLRQAQLKQFVRHVQKNIYKNKRKLFNEFKF